MRKKIKNKKGAASFYIVAFSTLIMVIIAASFAAIIISEVTRTSNDDLAQSAYDSALAGVEDAKLACKASAIYLLDGRFKLKFKYWFLWRWFYYIKEYSSIQLLEILEVGKKKIPLTQFFLITMSLTEARGTLMMMTTKEAERILREQSLAVNSQTESNSSGSSSQGTTCSA